MIYSITIILWDWLTSPFAGVVFLIPFLFFRRRWELILALTLLTEITLQRQIFSPFSCGVPIVLVLCGLTLGSIALPKKTESPSQDNKWLTRAILKSSLKWVAIVATVPVAYLLVANSFEHSRFQDVAGESTRTQPPPYCIELS